MFSDKTLEDEILEVLHNTDEDPSNLFARIRKNKNIADSTIREALWRLMASRDIELTPDRKFRIRADQSS